MLRWIKHLAHHKSYQTESSDPANPAGRQRFVAAMVAHCLLYASELEVPLTDAFLEDLENDLGSVNV